ncbi:GDSL-like lipase/acylhydrolase family protein [Tahibacter aquaticus]|uniref:GDSL-like lipase/acylhydrolase family protein n=1 Tax=Tahibacter aquaticus TaxID=520092 RepID=A0A4R6YIP3_9GAMM|nr:GDSL-type esterase/lipase family protein [Tahibacter aquaticus]TDR36592.1 GDSL-like lipase/acylhydrolase family protein [Tahibacter aquaticus]
MLQESIALGELKATAAMERRRGAAVTRAQALEVRARREGAALDKVGRAPSAGLLIAEGDSWFDYPFHDVLKGLEDLHGYDVESVAHKGDRVEDMAYSDGQLDEFTRRIEKMIRRGDRPRAVLLSGGGNDIAGDEFGMLLNHALSARSGLNRRVVEGIIDERLYDAYATIISAVTEVCQQMLGDKIPIVVHGYAYAVADGRGFWGGGWILPGPWLEPGFAQKGYVHLDQRQPLVRELIDKFNAMLQKLKAAPEFTHVRYVDLRADLQTYPEDYAIAWANELHPNAQGFATVAARFAEQLRELSP